MSRDFTEFQQEKEIFQRFKVNLLHQTVIFYDGSCYPNPCGPMGCGAVIYKAKDFKVGYSRKKGIQSSYSEMKIIHTISEAFPAHENNTNNVAEHKALGLAMKWLIDNKFTEHMIYVFGDNEMSIKQMKGEYGLNPSGKYYQTARENIFMMSELTKENKFSFRWIPRELNSLADSLSKQK